MGFTGADDQPALRTSSKINIVLIVLFTVVLVLHIVCFSVVIDKNREVADKFDPLRPVNGISDDDFCIFYINSESSDFIARLGDTSICNFVIYGSASLAACAILMIIFLALRTASNKE